MSSDKYPGEDNPSYAYDPAQRQHRDRWRRAVTIAEGVRPVLAVVFTACSAVALISSMGALTGAVGGLMGSGALEAEVSEPSLWATLRQSGALRIMALLGGFMLFSTAAAGVRAALGDAPGTLYLRHGGGRRRSFGRHGRPPSLPASRWAGCKGRTSADGSNPTSMSSTPRRGRWPP